MQTKFVPFKQFKPLFKSMTAGSQSALTFLIEAAPELPDPEYLQNNQKIQVKCSYYGHLGLSADHVTDLSVVSARSVSAPR